MLLSRWARIGAATSGGAMTRSGRQRSIMRSQGWVTMLTGHRLLVRVLSIPYLALMPSGIHLRRIMLVWE